jgi:dTDP-4-dehydrorhamnose 3,5-epimerase
MNVKPTAIPGCYEIQSELYKDVRGMFVKTVHRETFAEYGLESDFPEQYYTVSESGVVRGLHFQLPPHAHAKLVFCISGSVLDAVVDLRAGSPTYGKSFQTELSGARGNMLYIPRGLAHGFCAFEKSVMMYNVTSMYAPQDDAGLLWNSAGITWPVCNPVLSDRDRSFPVLDSFETPFCFDQVSA